MKTNILFENKTFFIAFFAFFVLLLSFFIEYPSYASSHSLTLSSSGAQDISVLGDDDVATISADAINVQTTCRYGYSFTISTSVNDNNLYLEGNASNNADGSYFSAVDGETRLSNTSNAWGYYYNNASNIEPTINDVFAPVPTLGNTDILKTPLAVPSSTDINDSFKLYYGVKASSGLATGTYKMASDTNNGGNSGTIVYQAVIADACVKYNVEFNPTDTSSGSNVTGSGTMEVQSIYEDVATPLSANSFVAPAGYSFVGWNTAQDGTGTWYNDGQSVTNLATVGDTIVLYAQWGDCPANKICYDKNEGTDTTHQVVGTMGQHDLRARDWSSCFDTDNASYCYDSSSNSIDISALPYIDGTYVESAILHASNFSRTGYGFAGWSDKADYATNNQAHFYGPQESLDLTAEQYSIRGIKLYAVWVASVGSLQDSTKVAQLCGTGQGSLTKAATDGTANLSSVAALTDNRDGQTYAIAKLADGKCWMIENLRVDDKAVLTTSNTNNPLNDGTKVTLKHNYTDTITYNTLSSSSDIPYDATTAPNGWCNSISANCYNQSRVLSINTTNRAVNPTVDINVNIYSYGNYYNWYSVTGGRGTYDKIKDNGSMSGDICPKGWHLPSGSGSGEVGYLTNSLGGYKDSNNVAQRMTSSTVPTHLEMIHTVLSFPNNFLRSGGFNVTSINNRGTNGGYWLSTAESRQNAYVFGFNGKYLSPGEVGTAKYRGRAARCVAPNM